MVAFTSMSNVSTLAALDSKTSGNLSKNSTSDIDSREIGRTINAKDIENGIISSSDGGDQLSLSLNEIVSREATFRENKLYALLLRPETLDLFEAISMDDDSSGYNVISAKIFQSNEHLFAFAELVMENLIRFADGHLILTPLCDRIMASIAEEWGHD